MRRLVQVVLFAAFVAFAFWFARSPGFDSGAAVLAALGALLTAFLYGSEQASPAAHDKAPPAADVKISGIKNSVFTDFELVKSTLDIQNVEGSAFSRFKIDQTGAGSAKRALRELGLKEDAPIHEVLDGLEEMRELAKSGGLAAVKRAAPAKFSKFWATADDAAKFEATVVCLAMDSEMWDRVMNLLRGGK